VRPGWDIPLNAVVVTMVFTAILSLIIIGSTTAFTIITSLVSIGLTSSYMIAIGCVVNKRIQGQPLPPSRFTLGRAGLPVNIAAMCFLALAYVMLFFPSAPNPTAASMNWTILIYGVALMFGLIYYYFRARHRYVGPVEYIKND
jgi:choline transport protein